MASIYAYSKKSWVGWFILEVSAGLTAVCNWDLSELA